jgi:hypothetical protein
MRYATIAMLRLAALTSIAGDAQARDGCGRGLFWNGYACVPEAPRYYAPQPRAYYGDRPI